MSSQKENTTGGLKGMAKAHAVAVLNLPEEPDEGYHALPDSPATWKLKHNGFFQYDGWCDGTHPNCTTRKDDDPFGEPQERRCDTKIWRISPMGREVLEWLEEPNTLPCGHQGIHNVRGGGYTCTRDSCNEEYQKEIAKQVIGR